LPLRVAGELLAEGAVDLITVGRGRPNISKPSGRWPPRPSASRSDPQVQQFGGAHGRRSITGVVVTYAQVASHPHTPSGCAPRITRTLVRVRRDSPRAATRKSWGEAMREAFGDATRRLALTGTPFRSDDSPIPFVTYEPDGEGMLRSRADHIYGYADALGRRRGAAGDVHWPIRAKHAGRTSAGEEHAARPRRTAETQNRPRGAWRTVARPERANGSRPCCRPPTLASRSCATAASPTPGPW